MATLEKRRRLPRQCTKVAIDYNQNDFDDFTKEKKKKKKVKELEFHRLCGECQNKLSINEMDCIDCQACLVRSCVNILNIKKKSLYHWKCYRCVEERMPRKRLSYFHSMENILSVLQSSEKIVVLAGAGMSTSCGIPDFRSKNGVYAMIKDMNLDLPKPENLFDIEYFQQNPLPFFSFAKSLYPKSLVPTKSHRFLRLLQDKKKLLRVYTQNVDTLEHVAGIDRVVYCHGNFATSTCLGCRMTVARETITKDMIIKEIPYCRKCQGVLKPDIIFFGEKLSSKVNNYLNQDREKADLLLVIGTSLKVSPMCDMISFLPKSVPHILINRESIQPKKQISEGFDVELLGESDVIVDDLCRRLDWKLENTLPELSELPNFYPPCTYCYSKDCGHQHQHQQQQQQQQQQQHTLPETPLEDLSHEAYTCDTCQQVIVHQRFKCSSCFDFDLCKKCYARGKNDHNRVEKHAFVQLPIQQNI